MADRNLDFDPTVTNVVPQKPDLGLLTGGAELADQVATMSANAKALNATTQTALAFRQADAQFRQNAAGNPNDPQALADLQTQRSEITSQIGQQVPAIASREYMSHVMEVQQNSDKLNELWGMQQSVKNAHANVNTSMETQYAMSADRGRQFGADDGNFANLDSVIGLEQANAAIVKFATPVLGAPQTGAMLKDFNTNMVKSFVAGLAEQHPQLASAALQQPNIAEHFTPQDIGDMADVIKKTTRQQELIQSMQTTKNDGSLADLINDPNTSYFEKRAAIDKMDVSGVVTPKSASAARRVIKSTDDLDSQTDTPVMGDIVNKTYDLNANATSSADDYLRGVQNIHQQILESQANGSLTGQDATKLTKQVNDLTSKKLSDATNTAGMEFYDANQKFNALPPEYRGQATRALFYAGNGQNWTPQQYGNQATQIVQQINDTRRQNALKTVNGIPQQDTEFLKSIPNASPEAIAATAKKYGISNQQVILQLRANAVAAARAKQRGVTRVAPDGATGDDAAEPSPAARTTAPEPYEDDSNDKIMQEMTQ